MSEEQNDSPAFRLRPRRAAPKSYYTVRLEYSANPAAFIRERPRGSNSSGGSGSKRKVFTQKTGSNSTKSGINQDAGHLRLPAVLTKEEREREERRAALHREISDSITTDTLISPFIERLQLDELEPDSVYEHNYITLRVKEVEELSNGRVLYCLCQNIESSPTNQSDCVNVYLYDEYAHRALVKPDKIISIAKFRTGLSRATTEENREETVEEQVGSDTARLVNPKNDSNGHTTNQLDTIDSDCLKTTATTTITASQHSDTMKSSTSIIKDEEETCPIRLESKNSIKQESGSKSGISTATKSSSVKDKNTLPFDVIIKYDELVVRSTSNSNRGTQNSTACTSLGASSVNRRPLIPFVSLTDMIDQPTEPFVEMSTSSPSFHLNPDDIGQNHENQESKKVKFTANLSV